VAWGGDFVSVHGSGEDVLVVVFEVGFVGVDEGDAGAFVAAFVEFVVFVFIFGEAVWVDADDGFRVVLLEFVEGGDKGFVPVLVEEGVRIDLEEIVFVL